MDEDSKALKFLKRIIVAWPLLLLPFVPAMGKAVASLILMSSVYNAAMQ